MSTAISPDRRARREFTSGDSEDSNAETEMDDAATDSDVLSETASDAAFIVDDSDGLGDEEYKPDMDESESSADDDDDDDDDDNKNVSEDGDLTEKDESDDERDCDFDGDYVEVEGVEVCPHLRPVPHKGHENDICKRIDWGFDMSKKKGIKWVDEGPPGPQPEYLQRVIEAIRYVSIYIGHLMISSEDNMMDKFCTIFKAQSFQEFEELAQQMQTGLDEVLKDDTEDSNLLEEHSGQDRSVHYQVVKFATLDFDKFKTRFRFLRKQMKRCMKRRSYPEWAEAIDPDVFHDLEGSANHLAKTIENFIRKKMKECEVTTTTTKKEKTTKLSLDDNAKS
ncbi:MAG: hypothetical protein Q9160_008709 [Pyrenula sp. 1 TL-2023]